MNFVIFCFIFYQITIVNPQFFTSPNFFKPRFISGTTNGIYAAVVFPIDLPGREAYLGWFFEAIHTVPSNQTEYSYPPLVERKIDKIDRNYVYNMIENKIKSKGLPGKSCLLRTICEVAMYSFQHANGIFGDIIDILLLPSSSSNNNLPADYLEAELFGRNMNCSDYLSSCNVSLLDMFSKLYL